MFKPDVKPAGLVKALGGTDNIADVRACVTRLRTVVHDPSLVDEAGLKKCGARGIVTTGDAIQIIIGSDAQKASEAIAALLEGE